MRNPTPKKYEKFKISKKEHNEIMNIKLNFFSKVNSYKKDDEYIFQYSSNFFGKLFVLGSFPIVVLFNGLNNIKEIVHEFKREMNPKKYNSLISERITFNNNPRVYGELIKIEFLKELK